MGVGVSVDGIGVEVGGSCVAWAVNVGVGVASGSTTGVVGEASGEMGVGMGVEVG